MNYYKLDTQIWPLTFPLFPIDSLYTGFFLVLDLLLFVLPFLRSRIDCILYLYSWNVSSVFSYVLMIGTLDHFMLGYLENSFVFLCFWSIIIFKNRQDRSDLRFYHELQGSFNMYLLRRYYKCVVFHTLHFRESYL